MSTSLMGETYTQGRVFLLGGNPLVLWIDQFEMFQNVQLKVVWICGPVNPSYLSSSFPSYSARGVIVIPILLGRVPSTTASTGTGASFTDIDVLPNDSGVGDSRK